MPSFQTSAVHLDLAKPQGSLCIICCNRHISVSVIIKAYLRWFHRDEHLDGESAREEEKLCIR